MSPNKKTKLNTTINKTLLKLQAIYEFKPSEDNNSLYINQTKYLVDQLSNTLILIDKYTNNLKDTYKLNKVLDYPIKSGNSLEQHIINIQLIQLIYNYVLDSTIEPDDILKYAELLKLYFNKIDTYIKYPSNWIGSSPAVWLLNI